MNRTIDAVICLYYSVGVSLRCFSTAGAEFSWHICIVGYKQKLRSIVNRMKHIKNK